jgi:hypothetical protein
MRQELVDAHLARNAAVVEEFKSQLLPITESVKSQVLASIGRAASVRDGYLEPGYQNASAIKLASKSYQEALRASEYDGACAAFLATLSSQVGEFETLYAEMQKDCPALPNFVALDDDDHGIIALRAALSMSALDASSQRVALLLRQASIFLVSRHSLEDVQSHVSGIVGKMSDVGQMAHTCTMSFFRGVASTIYRKIDPTGDRLKLKYMGKLPGRHRGFCSEFLKSEKSHSINEVLAMDNGFVPNPLDAGGGFGCSHYWVASEY